MSLRATRISQDVAALKKLEKNGVILNMHPFDPKKKSLDHLAMTLKGPKGTAYEGGLFKLEMKFPPAYPSQPPFVRLHTPIWHPNFWPKPTEYKGQRNICLALVDPSLMGQKDGWSPSKTAATVVQAIIAMFNTKGAYINPTDVFNKKAAQEMLKNPSAFDKKVKFLVKKYAREKW
ncbi:MAG TPA: ubiquitin-conjugating enzyme family protein [Candidatus Lokiarchaeia archaeon]|nr:ubiquitin-conjugating enzyme family protein [Candidatus Lokiarchaeia archaeon]